MAGSTRGIQEERVYDKKRYYLNGSLPTALFANLWKYSMKETKTTGNIDRDILIL